MAVLGPRAQQGVGGGSDIVIPSSKPSPVSLPVEPYNPQSPPGVPQVPGNSQSPQGSSSSGIVKPSVKSLSKIKSTLLRPALTSHYECNFDPPPDVRNYIKNNRGFNYDSNVEFITLSCSEASLPGSSLITNEINDDYTGVTERLAYRRQYDDRADFTFYVDHGRADGDYNIIWFFENWIQYIANEQFNEGKGVESENFNYRFRFPDGKQSGSGYRSSAIYINKFERELRGSYLSYRFLKAYPIAINSMPVSYDSSELLKCTVSFTYTRYVVNRLANSYNPFLNPEFGVDTTGQFGQSGFNITRNPLGSQATGGNLLGRQGPGF